MQTLSIFRACVAAGVAASVWWPTLAQAQSRAEAQRDPRPSASRGRSFVLGPAIGIEVRDASAAELTVAGLSQASAAAVTAVSPGGLAQKAGLLVGDLVVEFDGERVRGAAQLQRLVRESVPDRPVTVVVVREKARRSFEVIPTGQVALDSELHRQIERAMRDLPEELDRLRAELDLEGLRRSLPWSTRRRLGLEVQPLSSQLSAHFGVKEGLLVATVEADSPAAVAGVKAGDIVTAANGRSVRVAADLVTEVLRSAGSVTLTVVREKKELSLDVSLPASDSQRRSRRRTRSA